MKRYVNCSEHKDERGRRMKKYKACENCYYWKDTDKSIDTCTCNRSPYYGYQTDRLTVCNYWKDEADMRG